MTSGSGKRPLNSIGAEARNEVFWDPVARGCRAAGELDMDTCGAGMAHFVRAGIAMMRDAESSRCRS